MTQTILSEHIPTRAYELCPQCFKPITQYWSIKSIEALTGDLSLITTQRSCKCGYVEEHQTETKVFLDGGCYDCSSGCNGGCK